MIVYVAASLLDGRFTRICIASLRHFYPDVPIRILAGGPLQAGLTDELKKYWDVETFPTAAGDYGWGFVKLEPLFAPDGTRFLVLDSDTVVVGPVLDVLAQSTATFVVDNESQSDSATARLYYDWNQVREVDSTTRQPRFVFNSGQWFGTSGVLKRRDFSPWLEWTMPRRLRYPQHFMPGDQGILNYVINQQVALHDLKVERRKILHWPGHGMQGIDAHAVQSRSAPSLVVHWAGMKRTRQRDMVGSDLLAFFENEYYKRLPAGDVRKFFARSQHVVSTWRDSIQIRAKQASRPRAGATQSAPSVGVK